MSLFQKIFSSQPNVKRQKIADMSSIGASEKSHYKEDEYYKYRPFEGTAFDSIEVVDYEEQIKTVKPTLRGLYPPEIVMLNFCTKYPLEDGKKYPGYWWFEYGIKDVKTILDKLESKGLIRIGKNGKYEITSEGDAELGQNEAIVWAHKKKAIGSAWDVSRLLDGDTRNWKDKVWAEMNRLKLLYAKEGQPGLARNIHLCQAEFLEYEGRFEQAKKLYLSLIEIDRKLDKQDDGFIGYPGIIKALERCERKIKLKQQ